MFDYLRMISPTIVGIIILTISIGYLEDLLLDEVFTVLEYSETTTREVQEQIQEFSSDDLRSLLQVYTELQIEQDENFAEMKVAFVYMAKGVWLLPIWLLFCQLLYVILRWRIRDPNRTAIAYFIGFSLTLPIFGFVFVMTRDLDEVFLNNIDFDFFLASLASIAVFIIYLRHMRMLSLIYCLLMIAATVLYVVDRPIAIHAVMLCCATVDATIAVFFLAGKEHIKNNLDNTLDASSEVLTH